MSLEQCVASRHVEKTRTALHAIDAGLLQECTILAALCCMIPVQPWCNQTTAPGLAGSWAF